MKKVKLISIFSIISIILLIMGIIVLLFNYNKLRKRVDYLENKTNELTSRIEHNGFEIYNIQEELSNSTDKNTENNFNNSEEFIFENTSIEGLVPISENEAKKIWEDYKETVLLDNLNLFKYKEVKKQKVKPTNYFSAGSASNIKEADFERDAYVFYYGSEDDLSSVVGYVDLYTGKVIGGYYKGD